MARRGPVGAVLALPARLVGAAALLWGTTAALTHLVFVELIASPRIELGDVDRGQAVWIGAQAVVAAGSFAVAVLGVLAPTDYSDPRRERRRSLACAAVLATLAAGGVGAAYAAGIFDAVLTIALAGALTIGTTVGLGVVWLRIGNDLPIAPVPAPPRLPELRPWGSRGR